MSKTGYDVTLDKPRLDKQLGEILQVMLHAQETNTWLTLREIWQLTKHGESSISAQLRNLRKAPYHYIVEKRRRGEGSRGLWEYRVSLPEALPLFEASA